MPRKRSQDNMPQGYVEVVGWTNLCSVKANKMCLYIVELWKIIGSIMSSVPIWNWSVRLCSKLHVLQVNTRNILFICGGAFFGLEKIVAERLYS